MSTTDVMLGQADLGTGRRDTFGASRDVACATEVERGQELARLEVEEMVIKIRRRAREHRLDRGSSLRVPFFDDAARENRWRRIEVIPRGRAPFVLAFVAQAIDRELAHMGHEPLTEETHAHPMSFLETIRNAEGVSGTA